MRYKVIITRKAQKNMQHIPKSAKQKIFQVISSLSTKPYKGKKLCGEYAGLYAVRVWPYRIIYIIKKHTITVTIIDVQHRQGAYRK